MEKLFLFLDPNGENALIHTFAAHFYFVYVYPFCDGNGRAARIMNASYLYHSGYKKMKSLPLANAIKNQLNGYYTSLTDSETILNGV